MEPQEGRRAYASSAPTPRSTAKPCSSRDRRRTPPGPPGADGDDRRRCWRRIGTLYRHFPTREQLLTHLTHRSFERVLANAQAADRDAATGIEALRRFIQAAVDLRNELVLPLHGGPPVTDAATIDVQKQVHHAISHMIERGRADGTINRDVTARDIITFGSMLAQPRTPDPNWEATCARLNDTYLHGLSAREGTRA